MLPVTICSCLVNGMFTHPCFFCLRNTWWKNFRATRACLLLTWILVISLQVSVMYGIGSLYAFLLHNH